MKNKRRNLCIAAERIYGQCAEHGFYFALVLAKEQWAKMTPEEKAQFEIRNGAMHTDDMKQFLVQFFSA
jgi:hypothetical protein